MEMTLASAYINLIRRDKTDFIHNQQLNHEALTSVGKIFLSLYFLNTENSTEIQTNLEFDYINISFLEILLDGDKIYNWYVNRLYFRRCKYFKYLCVQQINIPAVFHLFKLPDKYTACK